MFHTILILKCRHTGEFSEKWVCGGYISQITNGERDMFPNHTLVAAIRSDIPGVAEHIKSITLENVE